MQSFDELLACPRCRGPLVHLRCARCAVAYPAPGGIPDLRLRDDRVEPVRTFYLQAPFPGYPPRDSLSSLRARAGRSAFAQLLDRSIDGDAAVLEIGCGTGQLSLFLATAERRIVGADLSRRSLELAEDARRRYGIESATFIETDLRSPGLRERAFDVVIASGVLHHTPDPRASFAKLAQLARPGGIVVVGLYNAFARIPSWLRRAVGRLSAFRFVPLDPVLRERRDDAPRREAWLRDQYQHPEEHWHTLAEVQGWFFANGVEYLRTYPSALLADEPDELFEPAVDNWRPEAWLAQVGWMRTLGREGGLFFTIGRRR